MQLLPSQISLPIHAHFWCMQCNDVLHSMSDKHVELTSFPLIQNIFFIKSTVNECFIQF